MSVWNVEWIGHQFDNEVFFFEADGTEWQIDTKISEKAFLFHAKRYGTTEDQAESQAVYNCHQVVGPSVGMEAIIKIRMQVPPSYPPSKDPKERADLALTYPGVFCLKELLALQLLDKGGCSVSPKLLTWFNSWQTPEMLIPGGYIMFLVMEKLPGEPLTDFWDRPFEEREKIRAAFRRAGTEFYSHRVYPDDEQLRNILYDAEEDKCYFLDFEDSLILDEAEEPPGWWDHFFFTWNLAYRRDGENHY